jgi:FkbH-like protein
VPNDRLFRAQTDLVSCGRHGIFLYKADREKQVTNRTEDSVVDSGPIPNRFIAVVRILLFTVVIAPLALSAAVIGGFILLVDWVVNVPWFVWLVASPFLYVAWFLLVLTISGALCRRTGRKNPKPRYAVIHTDQRGRSHADPGLKTVSLCYTQAAIITSLPLFRILSQTQMLNRLVLGSYSPSVQTGGVLVNWGNIYDPDLTEIGDRVIIGSDASVVAHGMTTRNDGAIVYVSAPVKIGNRATIGGAAHVALGCSIGEDAIVEPSAVLAPFSHIPAGEVWGGNPAQFRRKRDGLEISATGKVEANSAVVRSNDTIGERADQAVHFDDVRALVIAALGLDSNLAPAELSSESCPDWDSLGQIAIASAIFDRHGVAVEESQIYRIRTLQDVMDAIAGRTLAEPADDVEPARPDSPPPASQPDGAKPTMSLPDDLEMLPLLDPRDATSLLAERFHHDDGKDRTALRLVMAATFTAQPVATSLRLWGQAIGFAIDVQFADYNQIVQTLLDDRSLFASNRDGINVILARPEDLVGGSGDQSSVQMEQIFQAVRTFTERGPSRGQLLIGTLPPVVSSFSSVDQQDVGDLRHAWRARFKATPGVELFDFSRIVERIGVDDARSNAGEALHRAPYSPRLYQELGIALVRQIRAKRRSPAKVIAVDCDNTLWGGVVGEVGLDGIQLGPDGPGHGFQLFQHYLRQLKEKGILLAVVSRNEEQDVLEVFEKHPEMILRSDDIASWAVNWSHKSENLSELAEEMNLGIDSFVFLDDDPAVRLEVMTRRPEVHVVPLPEDPAAYCETLSKLWLFDGAQATAVDAARTRMMQEESRRKREQRSLGSLDQFLASLDLRVELGPPAEQEWPRVAQLTQRTNQFTLSLKRRTLEEVKTLGPDMSVLVLKASDRFGDYGLVGVGIVQPGTEAGTSEIDTLLMSCRALGRGVEDAFLYGLAQTALTHGSDRLLAPYVPGPRNGMIKDFLIRSGFSEIEPNLWALSIAPPPALPRHVDYHRLERVEAAAR